ncbi:MAG TPA: VWA domain-containing protein [Thermoanaerobaculia bacterium]|nr:VWA domain-containing protein [Thermoanaerobaculia bacterium]
MSRSATFILVAALLASPVFGQDSEQTFFESIDVNVVNVEVYVTDRDGKRVNGLTRDDFQVLEDGKPVEISNFYAVSEGRVSQPGAPAEPAAETAPSAEALPPSAPDNQRLYLAIFLDNRSLTPASRNLILKSVQDFTTRLRPEDRILIAAYDGSLSIRQGLTNDPATLAAALNEMAKVAPGGSTSTAERRRLLAELDAAYPIVQGETQRSIVAVELAEQLYHSIRTYGQQVHAENRAAIGNLKEFVDSLAGLPGRKALLFVSGGFALRPIETFMRAWESKFGLISRQVGYSAFDGNRDDATPLLQELIAHANSNRVTFYSLGATPELMGVSAEVGRSDTYDMNMEAMDRTTLQSSLIMVAGGTGGLSSVDAATGPMLDRMRQDFDTYYSLGYVPAQGRDGRRRSVEVKVRDASLRVRHREAHRERTMPERMTSRAMSALLLGEEDNPLEVAVDFGKEKKNDKGLYEVEVLVKFPLANLVLVPQDQFHEGRLWVFVGARDSHGRNSPITQVAVPIRVPNDQLLTALGQVGAYRMTLLLRPEPHTVAVAVRDEIGNADSTARAQYTPGQQETPGK